MYEQFFDMKHTPFTRNVPADQLFESQAMRETLGRLLLRCGPTTLCRSNSRTRMWKIHFDPTVLRRTS